SLDLKPRSPLVDASLLRPLRLAAIRCTHAAVCSSAATAPPFHKLTAYYAVEWHVPAHPLMCGYRGVRVHPSRRVDLVRAWSNYFVSDCEGNVFNSQRAVASSGELKIKATSCCRASSLVTMRTRSRANSIKAGNLF